MEKSLEYIRDVMGDEYFPDEDYITDELSAKIREITLTVGKPVVFFAGEEIFFADKTDGSITKNYYDGEPITDTYLKRVLSRLTDDSPYMFEGTISQGYIPFFGGIRVSVFGDGGVDKQNGIFVKKITTISFRVSRAIHNSFDFYKYITDGSTVFNTLIISEPGCGKTTLLRNIACLLSSHFRTGIADEREEICIGDMGLCSMIIRGLPKRNAFEIFIRNACADVIICDEIGGKEDAELIYESSKRGVRIVATIHGNSYEDIKNNPLSRDIYGFFDTLIFLSSKKGMGEVREIYFRGERQ